MTVLDAYYFLENKLFPVQVFKGLNEASFTNNRFVRDTVSLLEIIHPTVACLEVIVAEERCVLHGLKLHYGATHGNIRIGHCLLKP